MLPSRRPVTVILAAVALAAPALLAGCLGATTGDPGDAQSLATLGLPPSAYDGMVVEHTPFTASDGVVLDAWTWRPDAPDGERFPVILQDSPYYGNLDPPIEDEGQPFSQWLVRTFVPRGYAVVLKSVRGTGDSGGCFGMGDTREGQDGYEFVEWIATQAWADGNVGMIGKSYRGTTPIQTAALAPPSLKTIVPIAGITDWILYTNSPGGVPYSGWVGFNALYQVTVGYTSGMPTADDPATALRYAEKACPTAVELMATETGSIATGEKNDGWRMRDYAKDVEKMTASVYLVHGLVDFNVKPDQVAPWFNAVPTEKRALLGQWPHEYPDREDWALDLYRWFEHTLKGADNGIDREPPVKVEDSTGRWRYESQWPPARATTATFSLREAGTLTPEAGEAGESLSFRAEPGSEPDGARAADGRQLVFATSTLAEPLHVAGIPELAFNGTIDRAFTTFAVEMYDVAGDEWTPINWAFLDTRHREGTDTSSVTVPGTVEAYPLRFFPMDHVFLPGHQLAIAIAGADPDWITNVPTGATTVMHLGPDATLRFPVVTGGILEDPQPATKDFAELEWYKETG